MNSSKLLAAYGHNELLRECIVKICGLQFLVHRYVERGIDIVRRFIEDSYINPAMRDLLFSLLNYFM